MSHTYVLHSIYADRARATGMMVALWVSSLFLSLFGAPEIAAWIAHDTWLGAQGWAVSLGQGLLRASEVTGVRRLHDAADELVEAANPKVVFLREPANDFDIDLTNIEAQLEVPLPAAGATDPRVVHEEGAHRLVDDLKVHRVLLVGESSIQLELGVHLEKELREKYQGLTLRRFGKLSTSLVRPDYFDWPAKLRELLDEFHPDLVIGNFGGNDAQNISDNKGNILRFRSEAWDLDFGSRVTSLVEQVQKAGASVVLIGMPVMREPHFSNSIEHVNSVVKQRVEEKGETYITAWDLSAESDGSYRASITVDGVTGLMRWPDGVHYSALGATYVARRVLERIERHVTLVPLDRELAIADAQPDYVAYVPQPTARGEVRAPVALLRSPWSESNHRALQRMAAERGTIVVVAEDESVLNDVDKRLSTNGVRRVADDLQALSR